MFVAVARLTLCIPDAHSLKGKRQVLRKILDRVRARFDVSIAEVGENDRWQRAVVGIAIIANSAPFAQSCLDSVVAYIEETGLAPITDRANEIIPLGGGLHENDRTLAEAEADQGNEQDDEPL